MTMKSFLILFLGILLAGSVSGYAQQPSADSSVSSKDDPHLIKKQIDQLAFERRVQKNEKETTAKVMLWAPITLVGLAGLIVALVLLSAYVRKCPSCKAKGARRKIAVELIDTSYEKYTVRETRRYTDMFNVRHIEDTTSDRYKTINTYESHYRCKFCSHD